MKRTLIKDLVRYIGENVKIEGWVKKIRQLGMITFLIIRDRSGSVQVVYEGEEGPVGLSEEAVVSVTGTLIREERAPGGFELRSSAENIQVVSPVREQFPFEVDKAHYKVNADKLYNHRAFSLRNENLNSIFSIQAGIMNGFRNFLTEDGFTEISSPKIVAAGTEGGTELFTIEYFEQQAYLAQSPQFYKQMMVGAGYERVFEIGKAYRAEKHDTSRHINEYVSLDYEMGFIKDYQEVMELETSLMRYLMEFLAEKYEYEFAFLGVDLPVVPEEIPQITIKEAGRILNKHYAKEMDLSGPDPEGERLLAEWAKQELNSEWLFLTRFSAAKRPFYTMFDQNNREETLSFDLLFRGIEVTTGGQRIHDYQILLDNMKRFGLNPVEYQSYLDIFKYGMPPHGGLAIGLERLTMKLCGLNNIREASLFPRDRQRLIP